MDFELSADDLALQSGIVELCRGRFTMDRIRASEETGALDQEMWSELVDAGVFSLRLPEDEGGVGLGCTQAVLVFEQLGRALVPGPLVATHLGADFGLTGIVGMVDRDVSPLLVEHLDSLDRLLILAPDGVWVCDADDVQGGQVDAFLDPLTPLYAAASLPKGQLLASDGAGMKLRGAALTAAYQVGIATAVTERAVAYAKERRQFDRPIGSFQAVKHICADMLVRAEVARAAVYAAGVILDDPSAGDETRAVVAAQLLANEAAVANGKACVQVHGGMGFTWEVDVHLFLKRAALLATHFGSNDERAETMAAFL
ncbi:MAG: acyl-CoA dehydrogenase family protein [Actinomycetota bacterium]|nr:acyl-CoA/acyl-ACP dehydrogenase [Actinomycetota bacterium]